MTATPTKKLELIAHKVDSETRYAKKQLDEWQARFAANPADAFEWSAPSFKNAAKYNVGMEIGFILTDCKAKGADAAKTVEAVRKYLYERVIREASSPSNSTSVPSNEITKCLLAARAEWLESVDRLVA